MRISVAIGVIGCGTVGSNVVLRLLGQQAQIESRTGVRYELRRIAVRSLERPHTGAIPKHLFTDDAISVASDPEIDLVIECAGGTGHAADLVERALERGAHVVTANKDLLATQGPRLHALAATSGGLLSYEAAVCGAIPIVRVLREALAGDRVLSVAGIVNGTTTAILSAMENGAGYMDALADAQRRGYAEADPAGDIDGWDAAHKLALLIQLAFRRAVISPQIERRGIAQVTSHDVARARKMGYRLRLIAAARLTPSGIGAHVAPVLIPEHHAFAQTFGPQNAIRILAQDAGTLLLAGEGAGGAATASAVLADVIAALKSFTKGAAGMREGHMPLGSPGEITPLLVAHPNMKGTPRYSVWDDERGAAA